MQVPTVVLVSARKTIVNFRKNGSFSHFITFFMTFRAQASMYYAFVLLAVSVFTFRFRISILNFTPNTLSRRPLLASFFFFF
jgi:hypothetical protein